MTDLLARWVAPLPWGASGSFDVNPILTSYPDSLLKRQDKGLRLAYGLSRAFKKRWHGELEYAYWRNASTLDAATFDKHSLTLGVTYDAL